MDTLIKEAPINTKIIQGLKDRGIDIVNDLFYVIDSSYEDEGKGTGFFYCRRELLKNVKRYRAQHIRDVSREYGMGFQYKAWANTIDDLITCYNTNGDDTRYGRSFLATEDMTNEDAILTYLSFVIMKNLDKRIQERRYDDDPTLDLNLEVYPKIYRELDNMFWVSSGTRHFYPNSYYIAMEWGDNDDMWGHTPIKIRDVDDYIDIVAKEIKLMIEHFVIVYYKDKE